MIIGRDEIVRLASSGARLISPFNKENVRRSSYDLTVGDEYYSGCNGQGGAVSAKRLGMGHSLVIPPHGLCFVLSSEAIHLPLDLTAKVSLRMFHVYDGLVLTAQPPFDPGYKGRVIVMIHNLSSSEKSLKRGERLATIEFTKVCGLAFGSVGEPTSTAHRSVSGIAEQLRTPVRSGLNQLAARAVSVEKKVTDLQRFGMVFVALLLATAAIPPLATYGLMESKMNDLRSKLERLEKEVEAGKLSKVSELIGGDGAENRQRLNTLFGYLA